MFFEILKNWENQKTIEIIKNSFSRVGILFTAALTQLTNKES
jgi:hypothetical protein